MVHAVAVLRELSPRSSDAITSFGETLSSRLVAARLVSEGIAAEWVDARRVLVTDASYGHAQPDMGATTAPGAGRGRPAARHREDPRSGRLRRRDARRSHDNVGPGRLRLLRRDLWSLAGRERDPDLDRRRRYAHGRTHGSFPTPDSSRD